MIQLKHSITLITASILLAACGDGGGSDTTTTEKKPFIKATLVKSDNTFPWEQKILTKVNLIDQDNQPVAIKSCVAEDKTKVTVKSNCGDITVHRLGNTTITVTGANNLTTNFIINGVPTKSPLAVNNGGTAGEYRVVTPDSQTLTWGQPINYGNGSQFPTVQNLENGTPLKDIYQVAASSSRSLALNSKGQVYSWGVNHNSTEKPGFYPELVLNKNGQKTLDNIVTLASSSDSDFGVLGVTDDGRVMEWAKSATPFNLPTFVLDNNQQHLQNIRTVAAGPYYGYAVNAEGNVFQWSLNPSQPRSFSTMKNLDGTDVTGVVKIIADGNRTIALTKQGEVLVTGNHRAHFLADPRFEDSQYTYDFMQKYGQDGNWLQLALKVSMNGQPLYNIKDIGMNGSVSYAVTGDGNVLSWGTSSIGELGDGAAEGVYSATGIPKLVINETKNGSLSDVVAITGGGSWQGSVIALKKDGSLVGWGSNNKKRLTKSDEKKSYSYPIIIQKSEGKGLVLDMTKYTKLI